MKRRLILLIHVIVAMSIFPAPPLLQVTWADCEQPSPDGCSLEPADQVGGWFSSDGEAHQWWLTIPDTGDLTLTLAGPTGEYRLYVYRPDEADPDMARATAPGIQTIRIPEAEPGDYEIWVDSRSGRAPTAEYGLSVDWSGSSIEPLIAVPPPVVTGPPSATPSPVTASHSISIDSPSSGSVVTAGDQVNVAGWAGDSAGPGAGVDTVQVYLDGGRDSGGTPLGAASYGGYRPEVASSTGNGNLAYSGFNFSWSPPSNLTGNHTLYIYSHSVSGSWVYRTVPISIVSPPPPLPPPPPPVAVTPPPIYVQPIPLPPPLPPCNGYYDSYGNCVAYVPPTQQPIGCYNPYGCGGNPVVTPQPSTIACAFGQRQDGVCNSILTSIPVTVTVTNIPTVATTTVPTVVTLVPPRVTPSPNVASNHPAITGQQSMQGCMGPGSFSITGQPCP